MGTDWLRNIPGRTVAAMILAMMHGEMRNPPTVMEPSQGWFDGHMVVASMTGESLEVMLQ